ncbi:uncharacterized protein LOC133550548 [Nerophis ophidion]|uniref:uncharacterized protein LOC133550548 n=1 Tax=Nerophis ophidion TaxID=159077 RepID=UPI002AE06BDB|nr:uncharacterized protein LOC133550548 [Nerophis ophidion]
MLLLLLCTLIFTGANHLQPSLATMKTPAILPLVFSVMILRALLSEAQNNSSTFPALSSLTPRETPSTSTFSPDPTSPTSHLNSKLKLRMTPVSSRSPDLTSGGPSVDTPVAMFDRKECFPVLMLTTGLFLLSAVLLLSTLTLAFKVCQMSRRIKMLGSKSEHWMESAGRDKSNSETDRKETSMLLADMSRPQEEVDDHSPKEEKGEEEQKDAEETEETADVTQVDGSAFPKQQIEDAASSEEPKDAL